MFVNLYNLMCFLKNDSFKDKILTNTREEVTTSEGESSTFRYFKSIFSTFINEDMELSQEYLKKTNDDLFFKIISKNRSLYDFKNLFFYLFSGFHIFTYALVILLFGWYFDIGGVFYLGVLIIFVLLCSFLIILRNYKFV